MVFDWFLVDGWFGFMDCKKTGCQRDTFLYCHYAWASNDTHILSYYHCGVPNDTKNVLWFLVVQAPHSLAVLVDLLVLLVLLFFSCSSRKGWYIPFTVRVL